MKKLLPFLMALILCGAVPSSASPALPDGLKALGEEALCGVPLEGIALPEGLETIGSGAFVGSGLKWVSIPDSVTEIAEDAFRDTGGPLLILASADSAAARFVSLRPPEGGAFRLTAAVLPEAATDRFVTWESSNPAVASVKDGEVTALKSGTAVITVRSADGGKTASCAVTVCPDDGTVCLVCMGYELNADGSMRPELIGRLKMLLGVAGIFPNAAIVCTGGATASGNSGVTEAGQMANWLRGKGIASGRILAERDSRTTAENAVNTLKHLSWRRPRTAFIVIVTSDYHMSEAVKRFKAAAAGTKPRIVVVAGEAWQTGSPIPPSGGR